MTATSEEAAARNLIYLADHAMVNGLVAVNSVTARRLTKRATPTNAPVVVLRSL